MRKFIPTALLSTTLAFGIPLAASADNPYWKQYGGKSVLMEQVNNGAKQVLNFVDYKNGMLIAELDGGIGEISMPVSESMAEQLRLNIKQVKKARNLSDQGNHSGALDLLREPVYPLVKFHEVPEVFIQLHVPVRFLLDTLIAAEELDEAQDLIERIKLDKVDLKYSERAISLMNAQIITGNMEAAAIIAQSLPVEGDYSVNIRPVIDAADQLRGAGQYEAVIPLYRAIENAVADEARTNVRMWLAYSLVLADRVDEATEIINKMTEPAPSEKTFSLYKLLEGSREYQNKNYAKALDILTRGFVRAQTSYSWVPETLFLIGDCYKETKDPLAARNVWTELTVLYPETRWAKRANKQLPLLPKVEQAQQ